MNELEQNDLTDVDIQVNMNMPDYVESDGHYVDITP